MEQVKRDSKLAAARRKLKQFKRKQEQKSFGIEHDNEVNNAQDPNNDIEIKESEEFIDKKFEILQCANQSENYLQSTKSPTENILHVTAKLNFLAEEANMIINGNSTSQYANLSDTADVKETSDTVDITNQDMAKKNFALSRENVDLREQCQQLENRLMQIETKYERKSENIENDSDVLHEQMQMQMQTIGVLVSEKQDIQQEVISLRAETHANQVLKTRLDEELCTMREKLQSLELDFQNKCELLGIQMSKNAQLQIDNTSLKKELVELQHTIDSENIQSSELAAKLQLRNAEFKSLHISHEDLHEKLQMADVLLKQISASKHADSVSEVLQLQHENEKLGSKISEYQQAFEELSAEREHMSKQYADMVVQSQETVQDLQFQIKIMEGKTFDLTEECDKLRTSSEHDSTNGGKSKQNLTDDDEISTKIEILQDKLDVFNQEKILLKEDIAAQQRYNQQLVQLIEEKETYVHKLESQLENATYLTEEHSRLLEDARSDKVTISCALSQNKQLKVQLEEMQEGFIRMSNDNMDLATKVSSLEHENKNLQSNFKESLLSLEETRRNVEQQVYQQEDKSLQQRSEFHEYNDEADDSVILRQKLVQADAAIDRLSKENMNLTEKLASTQQKFSQVEFADISKIKLYSSASEGLSSDELPHGISNGNAVCADSPSLSELKAGHEKRNTSDQSLDLSVQQLQNKFISVMKEKAEIFNKLELLEHANTQLQNECDTIGEYIALYHNQRQMLKQRHREKDEYISTIIQEREAMQGKVEQLQTLIIAMLNHSNDDLGLTARSSGFHYNAQCGHTTSDLVIDQYENSPISNCAPTDSINSSDVCNKVETAPNMSVPPEAQNTTATQILSILEEMQKPNDSSWLSNKISIPSGFCMRYTGPYAVI